MEPPECYQSSSSLLFNIFCVCSMFEVLLHMRDAMDVEGRWMMFVDGENLTRQAKTILPADISSSLDEGKCPEYYLSDVFIWFPVPEGGRIPEPWTFPETSGWDPRAVRCYYYATVNGTEEDQENLAMKLRRLDFEPRVFKRPRDNSRHAKGVDISLASDLLAHCHGDHFDTAVLVAGDQDYIPLVQEVKRMGKRVVVWFFAACAPQKFRLIPDRFTDISDPFIQRWGRWARSR